MHMFITFSTPKNRFHRVKCVELSSVVFHVYDFVEYNNSTKATKKKELQPLKLPLYSRNMKKITRKSDSPFRMADLHIFLYIERNGVKVNRCSCNEL